MGETAHLSFSIPAIFVVVAGHAVPVTNKRDDLRSGLTEQKLLRGWSTGASGVKIRLATAADVPAVKHLLLAAEVDLTDEMAEAVRDGTMGRAHRAALTVRNSSCSAPWP